MKKRIFPILKQLATQLNQLVELKGGPGSGNFNHGGRPGQVGGSGGGGVWEENLSSAEKKAIGHYTSVDHKIMKQIDVGRKTNADWQEEVDNFRSALQKAPNKTGEFYRGLAAADEDDIVKNFTRGGVFEMDTFTSFTASKDIAIQYAKNGAFNEDRVEGFADAVLHVKTSKAKDISPAAKYKEQQEHVLDKGTKYRVTKIDKSYRTSPEDGSDYPQYEIFAEEI